MREVTWAPGVAASGADIDLPAGSPAIARVIAARHHTMSDGTVAGASTAPTPTKVDEDTITIDEATTTASILTLQYEPVGELVKVS